MSGPLVFSLQCCLCFANAQRLLLCARRAAGSAGRRRKALFKILSLRPKQREEDCVLFSLFLPESHRFDLRKRAAFVALRQAGCRFSRTSAQSVVQNLVTPTKKRVDRLVRSARFFVAVLFVLRIVLRKTPAYAGITMCAVRLFSPLTTQKPDVSYSRTAAGLSTSTSSIMPRGRLSRMAAASSARPQPRRRWAGRT